MPKRLDTRHCVVIVALAASVALFFCVNVRIPSAKNIISRYAVVQGVSSKTLAPRRKSLLIIGQGRSGTSFVSKMFANGERVSNDLNDEQQNVLN